MYLYDAIHGAAGEKKKTKPWLAHIPRYGGADATGQWTSVAAAVGAPVRAQLSRARSLSLTRVARRRLRSFLPRGGRTPRSSDRAGRRARCLCLGRRAVQVPAPAELSRASQTRLSRHGFTSVSAADVRTGLSAEEAYAQLAADAADVELEASDPLARHEITLQARSRTLVLFNHCFFVVSTEILRCTRPVHARPVL